MINRRPGFPLALLFPERWDTFKLNFRLAFSSQNGFTDTWEDRFW